MQIQISNKVFDDILIVTCAVSTSPKLGCVLKESIEEQRFMQLASTTQD